MVNFRLHQHFFASGWSFCLGKLWFLVGHFRTFCLMIQELVVRHFQNLSDMTYRFLEAWKLYIVFNLSALKSDLSVHDWQVLNLMSGRTRL